jgi:L-fucose isomerase-like protein
MNRQKDSVELREFINSTLDAIERGADLKHRSVDGSVEFEVTVKRVSREKGGVKLYVFSGGAEKGKERVATVNFSVRTKGFLNEAGGVRPKPPRIKSS